MSRTKGAKGKHHTENPVKEKRNGAAHQNTIKNNINIKP
jgi:hypothetical protein